MSSLLEQIAIERLAPCHYRLRFPTTEIGFEVHSSVSADIDRGTCAVDPVRDGVVEVAGLPPAQQHFFHVFRGGEHLGIVSHRHIPLEGTPNFRDFGGYVTREGRFVRWGRLYRSGMLSTLTDADLQHFENLGIGLVCDFRREDECRRDPSRWPQVHLPRVEALPLAPGNHAQTLKNLMAGGSNFGAEDVVEAMKGINREFVLEHGALYGRLLRLVLECDRAVLIHCSVGKDRTGFGAAVILAALGVPEATIMRDYLLTSEYLLVDVHGGKLAERFGIAYHPALFAPAVETRPEYLQAAFESIRQEYGDIDAYLREGLQFGADAQAELRARLLI